MLRLFGGLAAAGVTSALAGCSSDEASPDTGNGQRIAIGFIAPTAGSFAAVGADMLQGLKLFLSGNANRLGRFDVDLVTQDEGATADSARAAADALIKRGVLALTGVANPASLLAMRDLVEEARTPLISSNASPSALTSANSIWRASYVDGEAGATIGAWAATRYQRVYLMVEDNQTGEAEAREFIAAFVGGGREIVANVRGTGNFAARLGSVGGSGAQALFAAYSGQNAWQMLDAFRSSGLSLPLLGPGSLTETRNLPKLVEKNGRLPQDVFTAMNYAPDLDNDANRQFVSAYYRATGSQPTAYAMAAFDTAAVLDKALLLLGDNADAAALNRKLGDLGQIESPRGTWAFNIKRTPQQQWYLRRLTLDGQVPANLVERDLQVLS